MEKCISYDECQRRFLTLEGAVKERVRDQDWQRDIGSIEKEMHELKNDIKDLTLVSNEHSEALAKLEMNVNKSLEFIREQIKDIKESHNKIIWWLIGTMGTSILSLIATLISKALGK